MRLGKRHLPLLGRYLLAVSILGMLVSDTLGQSKTSVSNFTSVTHNNTPTPIRPLSIGDQVPDIVFENVLNYKSKKARLSDFKGKLVILDMWSVYCTSCIAAFPEMEKLQKKFGDKLQILLVNPHDAKYDSKEKIKSTLEKLKTRTGFYPSLPIPIHDSILNQYFPHQSVPHEIWIDENGKVVAITGSLDVTAQNIESVIAGRALSIAPKNDWAFDKEKPLATEDNDFIYRSMFTSYKAGIGFSSGTRQDKNELLTGYYSLNKTLRNFIDLAYANVKEGFDKNKIIYDVKNPDQYTKSFDPSFAYCYDLTIFPTSWKSFNLKQYLKDDLKRVFNISVRKEYKTIPCLIIKSTTKVSSLATKHVKADLDLSKESIKKYFHNYPVSQIIDHLNSWSNKPLVDQTGITENVDINFPDGFSMDNIDSLLAFLTQMGFVIKEEERQTEVIIVTDK